MADDEICWELGNKIQAQQSNTRELNHPENIWFQSLVFPDDVVLDAC